MNVRKLVVVLGVFSIGMIMTGCSMTNGFIGNAIVTEVQLNQANFDVLRSVTGEASASYFLGIGPSGQNLYAKAKQDMLRKAKLKGSQALVNITSDEKRSGFIIWRQHKVYVSAEIVEFK